MSEAGPASDPSVARPFPGVERQPGEGFVYLVGAGPGDPGLLTVRAAELVATADLILYDRLIPPTALDRARPDAELVYVGKRPRAESAVDGPVRQEQISRLMIDAAAGGKSVVRLKGGDPFVFGRGGEEAEALSEAGVGFAVVPGVTAGVAAPAYAGIPITHRDEAGAVAFVSGHEVPDWEAYARFPGTLAFYMGMEELAGNARALIEAGRDPAEPAAIIERGSFPDQRVLRGRLEELGDLAEREAVAAPAIVVVGEVAARGERLEWFRSPPLAGRTVLVTRARTQARELVEPLLGLGAEPVELPLIGIEPRLDAEEVRDAVMGMHAYALVVLTSANGVELLFEAMSRHGRDARALAQATVAAVGPATAEALARRGITADVRGERAVAEGLIEALEPVPVQGRPVLVAGAAGSRPVVADALRDRGAEVDFVRLYETVAEQPDRSGASVAASADIVTLASASAARSLAAALAAHGITEPSGRVASIGPVTTRAATDAGIRVDAEADPHTVEGLISAVVQAAGSQPADRHHAAP